MGDDILILALVIIVIGGIGSIKGAFIGSARCRCARAGCTSS
jgi:branched-subunit amino acid ABC-type transport system permease component